MVPDRTRRPGKWGGFSCALPQVNLDVAECFCGQHSWSAAILPEMTLTVFLSRRYAVVAALFAASVAGCSPATETSVQVQGRALFIAGTLDHGAKPLILGALDANPQVDTLAFTVNPGSVDDACTIDLGREIRRRGLSTRLAGDGALVSGGLTLPVGCVEDAGRPCNDRRACLARMLRKGRGRFCLCRCGGTPPR